MDIQVQELVESIKRDGVEAAEKKAQEIVQNAEARAAQIRSEAEKQAASILANAKAEAAQSKASGEAALRQAGRDLLLTVRKQLSDIFQALVKSTVSEAYRGPILESAIQTVIKSWAEDKLGAVVLNPSDEKALAASLKAKVAVALKSGLEIRTSSKIEGGFVLEERGGVAYYDFTDEALAAALASYLNPLLAEILASTES